MIETEAGVANYVSADFNVARQTNCVKSKSRSLAVVVNIIFYLYEEVLFTAALIKFTILVVATVDIMVIWHGFANCL